MVVLLLLNGLTLHCLAFNCTQVMNLYLSVSVTRTLTYSNLLLPER